MHWKLPVTVGTDEQLCVHRVPVGQSYPDPVRGDAVPPLLRDRVPLHLGAVDHAQVRTLLQDGVQGQLGQVVLHQVGERFSVLAGKGDGRVGAGLPNLE